MTCLCITRNRREWLPKAIQCFLSQTYPNRELLILADGDDVKDLIPNDPRIRYVYENCSLSIGAKRNEACEQAGGDIIAVWDDDDHSAPGRLADQVLILTKNDCQVTGYHTMEFRDGSGGRWRYFLRESYVLGTSLCFWKSYWRQNKFPDLASGEDIEFCNKALPVLIGTNARDLMYATIHPGNQSPRQLQTAQYTAL